MNAQDLSPVPTPGELLGWLRSTGWQAAGQNPRWAEFTRNIGGQSLAIKVPLLGEASDYPKAAALLINDLADIEQRPKLAVLADVRSAATDVVRLSLSGTRTEQGRLDLGASADTMQGARDLLLAAACSVAEPRSAYQGRKHASAMEFLRKAELARVERGSFVLCIEVPVPPHIQGVLTDIDAPEPDFDRRVTRQLATGVAGVEAALRECAVQDSLDPFLQRAAVGVSANLCDGVALMMAAAQAERFDLRVGFAARRPVPAGQPRQAAIRKSDLPTLREVSRLLRGTATETAVRVQGPVVKLDRPTDQHHHRVTVQAEVGDRLALITIDLDEAGYQVAHAAHGNYQYVAVEGTLSRQGNIWRLTPSTPIEAVMVPEGLAD